MHYKVAGDHVVNPVLLFGVYHTSPSNDLTYLFVLVPTYDEQFTTTAWKSGHRTNIHTARAVVMKIRTETVCNSIQNKCIGRVVIYDARLQPPYVTLLLLFNSYPSQSHFLSVGKSLFNRSREGRSAEKASDRIVSARVMR